MSRIQGDKWTSIDEMKDCLTKQIVSAPKYEHGGVPLISDGKTMYLYTGEGNALIIGSTGCSKTRGVLMPTILSSIRAEENLFTIDAKCELYNATHIELKKRKYKTFVLNLRDLLCSSRWNPLIFAYKLYKTGNPDNMHKAMEMVNDMGISIFIDETKDKMIDPFWSNMAKKTFVGLVEALFMVGKEEEINLFNVYNMFVQGLERFGGSNYLTEFFDLCVGKDSSAYINISGTLNAANETRASIASVFLEGMQMFGVSEVMKDTMSHSGFDISSLTDEKTAIFVIVPDESTKYHKLAAIFATQVYQQYIRLAHEKYQGVLPRKVNFFLEEFGNMKVPDIAAMISACRSRNIRFFLVLQTLSQLDAKYTSHEADVIKTNCILWLFFHTNHVRTLEEISKLCGERRAVINNTIYKEPLISIAQLQRFEPRQVLIRLGGKQFVTKLPDISEYDFPKAEPAKFRKRKLLTIKTFDIKKLVRDIRDIKYKELFPLAEETMEKEQPGFDVDALIERINNKIAELEKEESEQAE